MKAFFVALRTWFQGKKTYLAAGVLFAIGAFALLDQNKTNDFVGMALLVMAFGLFGVRTNAERNAQFVARELAEIKEALARPGPKDVAGLIAHVAEDAVKDGVIDLSKLRFTIPLPEQEKKP